MARTISVSFNEYLNKLTVFTEGGDTVDSGSINAELLVDLGGDWDGGVDVVADNTDNGVGGGLGAGSGELSNDSGVGVEARGKRNNGNDDY